MAHEATVNTRGGQTAFNLADAGTQAAKRCLLLDANVFRYDGDTTKGGGEYPWSRVSDANNVCTSNSEKVIDLCAGTEMRVWIKYLLPTPNDRPGLLGNPN